MRKAARLGAPPSGGHTAMWSPPGTLALPLPRGRPVVLGCRPVRCSLFAWRHTTGTLGSGACRRRPACGRRWATASSWTATPAPLRGVRRFCCTPGGPRGRRSRAFRLRLRSAAARRERAAALKRIVSLRAMNEVKPDTRLPPFFYCKPVNDKGGPCHAPGCDHRGCVLQLKRQQHTKDGKTWSMGHRCATHAEAWAGA